MKAEIKSRIYNTDYEKPEFLVHYVGGYNTPDWEALDKIKAEGLKANYGGWALEGIIPNRPCGIFFFGEEMDHPLAHKVTARVADLDTDKLFAFPAALADAAAMIAEGHIDESVAEYDALTEIMSATKAVNYADYDGSFAAEWIYTGNIEPEALK